MSSAKIVKDTLFYGLVPKLTIFISVFTLPLITPYLTTYDYGISGVISSYSSFMVAILPLGLNVHLTNSFFELPRHYNLVWGRILYLMLFSSFIFFFANFVILFFTLPICNTSSLLLLCIIGSLPILYTVNNVFAQHLFPLVQTPKPLVMTNLLGSVLGILLSFILIYYFHLGYWGLVVPSVFSGLVVFILFVKFVWVDYDIKPIMERKMKRVLWMLKISLPLVPHTLGFVFLTSSARVVMSQMDISYNEIGLYSHGCSMGDYAVMVTTALVTAISPQIQRAYRDRNFTKYRKLYYLCQSVALVSSICICLWLPEIYSVLIRNEELKLSLPVASLLCFSNVVMAFYVFLSTPVFIEKNTMLLLWLVFVPGVINLTLCVAFIPIFGYMTAVYASIISYWSQLLIPFFVGFYKQNVSLWLGNLKKIIYILILLLACLVVSQYLSEMSFVLKLLTTMVVLSSFGVYYKHNKMNELL